MTRYGSESGGLPPSRWQGQAPGGSSCDVSASPFTAAPVWDGSAIVRPHTVGSSGFFYMMMIWDGDRWVLGGHSFPLKRGQSCHSCFHTTAILPCALCLVFCVVVWGRAVPPKNLKPLNLRKKEIRVLIFKSFLSKSWTHMELLGNVLCCYRAATKWN